MVEIKRLFCEGNKPSMMRVMSILCCVNALIISWVGLSKAQVDYSGLSLLVSTFLTAAMGGKIFQKRVEVTGAKSDVSVEKSFQ